MSISKAKYRAQFDPDRYSKTSHIHDYYETKIDHWIIAFSFVSLGLLMAIWAIIELNARGVS